MEIVSWIGSDKERPLVRTGEGCFVLNLTDDYSFTPEELEVELAHASLVKQLKSGNSRHTYYCSSNFLIVIHQRSCLGFNTAEARAFPLREIIGMNLECRECLSCNHPGQPCWQRRSAGLRKAI